MSGIAAAPVWFREESPPGSPNTNLVHVTMEDRREAFCGEVSINYAKCETFTTPPGDGNVHDACQKAFDEQNK